MDESLRQILQAVSELKNGQESFRQEMNQRFDHVQQQFDHVQQQFDHVNLRLDRIESNTKSLLKWAQLVDEEQAEIVKRIK